MVDYLKFPIRNIYSFYNIISGASRNIFIDNFYFDAIPWIENEVIDSKNSWEINFHSKNFDANKSAQWTKVH